MPPLTAEVDERTPLLAAKDVTTSSTEDLKSPTNVEAGSINDTATSDSDKKPSRRSVAGIIAALLLGTDTRVPMSDTLLKPRYRCFPSQCR